MSDFDGEHYLVHESLGNGSFRRTLVPILPCRHRGAAIGLEPCASCGDGKQVKVFPCAIRGRCTIQKEIAQAAVCQSCPDRRPAGGAMLLTGGIGDVFAVEAMMRPEERDQLEAVYCASYAGNLIKNLFELLPGVFPRLTKIEVLQVQKTYYDKASIDADFGVIPADDWSIGSIFSQQRTFTGSSFLAVRLAMPRLPAEPYCIVCPASTWGQWPGRNFDEADWRVCLDYLESRRLIGVVIGNDQTPLPASDWLLDRRGKTSLGDAIEIIKGGKGYLGIDTCWSVLAAKMYGRLAVKSVSDFCWHWKEAYFAPRRDFDFLARELRPPRGL
jgi:hypothetical protein